MSSWQTMIDQLRGVHEKLTSWEVDFLESIAGLDQITEGQRAKLEQIHETRT